MNKGSILVVNAGSSSLKFSVFRVHDSDQMQVAARGQLEGLGSRPHLRVQDASGGTLFERSYTVAEAGGVEDAITLAGAWLREHLQNEPLCAVGHRVVHGGEEFTHPVLIDADVLAALEDLTALAPLHQPHNLTAIRALREAQPKLPQIACFDTAFHRSHPPLVDAYALPWEYYVAGVRRYGFHGLSYEYIA